MRFGVFFFVILVVTACGKEEGCNDDLSGLYYGQVKMGNVTFVANLSIHQYKDELTGTWAGYEVTDEDGEISYEEIDDIEHFSGIVSDDKIIGVALGNPFGGGNDYEGTLSLGVESCTLSGKLKCEAPCGGGGSSANVEFFL